MSAPIEIKVPVAAAAAAVANCLVWAMQTYWFHGAVPAPVDALVQVVVPAVAAFAAGYLAPHTPRPDLETEAPGGHARDGDVGEVSVFELRKRDKQ